MELKGMYNQIKSLTATKDTIGELKTRKLKFPPKMWKGLQKSYQKKHQAVTEQNKMEGIIGRSDDNRKFMNKVFDEVTKVKQDLKKQRENQKRIKYSKKKPIRKHKKYQN